MTLHPISPLGLRQPGFDALNAVDDLRDRIRDAFDEIDVKIKYPVDHLSRRQQTCAECSQFIVLIDRFEVWTQQVIHVLLERLRGLVCEIVGHDPRVCSTRGSVVRGDRP